MRNMEVPVRAAKKAGLYTAGGVVYTVSPVHTDAYYARKTRELVALGVDAIYLKDPSGLLTPERAETLVPGSKPPAGSCRCICIRIASPALRPTSPAGRSSSASTSSTPQHRRWPTALPIRRPMVRRKHPARRLRGRRRTCPVERSPNGCATLPARRQAGRQHRRIRCVPLRASDAGRHDFEFEVAARHLRHRRASAKVLEEAARVRCELGYPIIVSPFAQFVMTQSVLNVMGKERYATVPDEVRKYVLGYYGEIAGPIDANFYDRITKAPSRRRPGPRSAGARHTENPARPRVVYIRRRPAAGSLLPGANTTH